MTPSFWTIEDGKVVRNELQMSAATREEIQKRIAEKFSAKVEPPHLCRQCRSREVSTRETFCSAACEQIFERSQTRTKVQEKYRPPQILIWLLIISIGLCVASFSTFCTRHQPQPAMRQAVKQ